MAESHLGETLKIWGNVADKAPRGGLGVTILTIHLESALGEAPSRMCDTTPMRTNQYLLTLRL